MKNGIIFFIHWFIFKYFSFSLLSEAIEDVQDFATELFSFFLKQMRILLILPSNEVFILYNRSWMTLHYG